jgi:hypothetical protein
VLCLFFHLARHKTAPARQRLHITFQRNDNSPAAALYRDAHTPSCLHAMGMKGLVRSSCIFVVESTLPIQQTIKNKEQKAPADKIKSPFTIISFTKE